AYGLDEKLEHKPTMSGRGRVIAFYAVAKLVGGGHAFEVMSVDQVNEIRDASQNYKFARDKDKTVWGQHYEEMGRKTVLRRLFKYLPVSIELANASALDGMHARGESQALDNVLEGDYITPASDDYADEDAPQLGNQPTGEAIQFDVNGFKAKMDACKDPTTLDLMADEIRELPQDVQEELNEHYRICRAELDLQ
ncbi:MAG: recombinase RecT, partial [Cupriavidus sp.]|nr:recombinase RecT [Cupriavidus sp.]